MKPAKLDWQFLGRDLLVPGVTMIVAVLALGASAWYHDHQAALHDVYASNQAAIHQDYDALIVRRRLVERYYQRYKEFQALGFVGRERRLDWIETIRGSARELDLPSVSYSLEPQLQAVQPVFSTAGNADISVFLTRLELELGLVHELDLLRFFARVESEAPGLMKVDSCDLARQGGIEDRLVAESNLLATCSMMLFSVITSDISVADANL